MNETLRTYARLLGHLRPYPKEVCIAYISMMGAALLNLFIPQVIKNAIDNGIAAGNSTSLFWAAGLIVAIAVIRAMAAFGQQYFGQWLTFRVAYDLRDYFYQSMQRLPFGFHDTAQTGDLMSRATSDITETERFVGMGLMDLLATVLLLIGVITAMLFENLRLALMVLPCMAVMVYSTIRFGGVIRPLFQRIQEQMGVLSTAMQESMTGINVVKAFAREEDEFVKFDRENDDWFERRYDAIKLWSVYWPLFTLILALSIVLLLWFGGPMALSAQITVGSLFAMISYVLMLNGPVLRLGFLVNMAATAGASVKRVYEIIDTPSTIEEPEQAVSVEESTGHVVFQDVTFGYLEDAPILQNISFVSEPGQVVALIGPTGSGKSSIINLIPRFYDPFSGQVLVDGVDVRERKLHELRRNIAIVLQEPFLFSSTIAENIAYGRGDATQEQIEAAAKAACAHDFILTFPDGYQTHVGERGVTLSGGQKQRVAIARALICDPRILILDDSTSAVDTETEHLIQQALQELMKGRTTFVIAQRLLSLKSADQILVLENGRIAERGTHDSLLEMNGLYRQIYDLQLKDQEEFQQLSTSPSPYDASSHRIEESATLSESASFTPVPGR
ncbi:MAG: ABC transporter ATP-binding protein [Chloroflexota bacterium]